MLNKDQRDFLLIPKALPSSTHFFNLRNILKPSQWDNLRKLVYQSAKHQCQLCARKVKLEAHEIWEFDFATKIQRLTGLVALCHYCHRLQHVMLLKLQHDQGKINAENVLRHYNRLTNSQLTINQFWQRANEMYQKLESITWEVDVQNFLSQVA